MEKSFVRPFRAAAARGLALASLAGCGEAPMTPPSSGHNPDAAQAAPARVGQFPPLPGSNMTAVGPGRQKPSSNRSDSGIVTQVEEAPTGRLIFGAGSVPYRPPGEDVTRAVDRAADRADKALGHADAAVDSAVRRADASVDQALDRADSAIGEGLGHAEQAIERADGTVRRVGGALKAIGEALERPEPAPR